MLKRFVALLSVAVMLLASGCSSEEERIYYDVPNTGHFYVEYDGREYNTFGTPCRYDATLENMGFLSYRARKVGSMETLRGNFPQKTAFYNFEPTSAYPARATHVLLAALPGESQYYLMVSYDAVEIQSGADLLEPLLFDEGIATLFAYDSEDPYRMWEPQTTEAERGTLLNGLMKAPLAKELPEGEPIVFMLRSSDGVLAQFSLYQNGAISIGTEPEKTVVLDDATNQLLHQILKGEERGAKE